MFSSNQRFEVSGTDCEDLVSVVRLVFQLTDCKYITGFVKGHKGMSFYFYECNNEVKDYKSFNLEADEKIISAAAMSYLKSKESVTSLFNAGDYFGDGSKHDGWVLWHDINNSDGGYLFTISRFTDFYHQ